MLDKCVATFRIDPGEDPIERIGAVRDATASLCRRLDVTVPIAEEAIPLDIRGQAQVALMLHTNRLSEPAEHANEIGAVVTRGHPRQGTDALDHRISGDRQGP